MREIPVTRGHVALVDDEDYELVSKFTWHVTGAAGRTLYAQWCGRRARRRIAISMHRMILGLTDPTVFVDHINHNGLDNRRSNLRTCTHAENLQNQITSRNNTSGHKGVYWFKRRQRWMVRISAFGAKRYLGYFTDKQAAVDAYEKAALELHGDFANPKGTG